MKLEALRDIISFFDKQLSVGERNLYAPKISAFLDYLEDTYNLKSNMHEVVEVFKNVKKDDIRKGLDYFIDPTRREGKKKVLYKKTAKDFVTAVNELFRFLHENEIVNDDIIIGLGVSKSDPKTVTELIKEIDNDPLLLDEEKFPPVTKEEYKFIVNQCNHTFNNLVAKNKEHKNFTDFTATIITKIILFSGVQYSLIIQLEIDCLDLDFNTISVNSMVIRLPRELSYQLKHYLKIRSERLEAKKATKNHYLFITYHGNRLPENTGTYLGKFLNIKCRLDEETEEELENTDRNHYTPTGISKFAIIQMIIGGIDQYIIKDFTGADNTIFEDCRKRVSFIYKQDSKYISRYLDSKLRNLETSDDL